MSGKKGFWDRVRGFVARKTCRLCGVKTGAEALSEKRGGATAAEWRAAAEKLVVVALPALLDELPASRALLRHPLPVMI